MSCLTSYTYVRRNTMKEQIGVVKEIDGPRRLVVPKEMRSLFHIDKAVELVVTEEGILL